MVQKSDADCQAYADPLRTFAKDVNTRIIPLYEAKNLFANVDEIVTASSAFLSDLEEIWAAGLGSQAVGEVCLRHVSALLERIVADTAEEYSSRT